ncbi:MAG: protein translocase subunit SecD [Acetobacteraceae bacterium]|nr:protein translocase subunit SecD [Acetobacteraceae bacterium]
MMNFSRLKAWLIIGVVAAGALFSIPNLIPKHVVPEWLPLRTVNLGLDLRGGSYLLMEVDMNAVVRERLESITDAVRTRMRTANLGYTGLAAEPAQRRVVFRLRDSSQGQTAVAALRELAQSVSTGMGQTSPDLEIVAQPDGLVSLTLTEVGLREKATLAVQQSIEIVRRRVDPDGTREASLVRQGSSRILLTIPGEQNPDAIKRLVGTTAKMTFHLLDESASPGPGAVPPPGVQFLRGEGRTADQIYAVRRRVEVDGANLSDARAGQNPQTGEWVVNFTFDSVGTRRFAEVTRANVGRPFAIVLDDKVITAPVIREPITGGRGQISGSFTAASANELAVLLRAGALPAPLTVVEERTVGPDLGADAIRAGLISVFTGLLLVCGYMVLAYGLFGWFATIAVVANLIITIGLLSLLQATLTLPGIAGLLLSVGMSVDANILINERVREEVKNGRTPLSSLEAGYTRAFATIVDSNLTVLIKMTLLYAFGTGPIAGFAVTVGFGVLTSMFTATMLVRLITARWYRAHRPSALPV